MHLIQYQCRSSTCHQDWEHNTLQLLWSLLLLRSYTIGKTKENHRSMVNQNSLKYQDTNELTSRTFCEINDTRKTSWRSLSDDCNKQWHCEAKFSHFSLWTQLDETDPIASLLARKHAIIVKLIPPRNRRHCRHLLCQHNHGLNWWNDLQLQCSLDVLQRRVHCGTKSRKTLLIPMLRENNRSRRMPKSA